MIIQSSALKSYIQVTLYRLIRVYLYIRNTHTNTPTVGYTHTNKQNNTCVLHTQKKRHMEGDGRKKKGMEIR